MESELGIRPRKCVRVLDREAHTEKLLDEETVDRLVVVEGSEAGAVLASRTGKHAASSARAASPNAQRT
jgi:hypothetical protein